MREFVSTLHFVLVVVIDTNLIDLQNISMHLDHIVLVGKSVTVELVHLFIIYYN